MTSKKIIAVDIDGVLVSYPEHFEKYVYDLLKVKYSLKEIKRLPQYKLLKYSYRISSIKRTLPLLNDKIPRILDKLRKSYIIWIVTTRPIEISGMDTIEWLSANRIHYDELMFIKDKLTFLNTIKGSVFALIDDDENNLTNFGNNELKTIHIRKPGDWVDILKTKIL